MSGSLSIRQAGSRADQPFRASQTYHSSRLHYLLAYNSSRSDNERQTLDVCFLTAYSPPFYAYIYTTCTSTKTRPSARGAITQAFFRIAFASHRIASQHTHTHALSLFLSVPRAFRLDFCSFTWERAFSRRFFMFLSRKNGRLNRALERTAASFFSLLSLSFCMYVVMSVRRVLQHTFFSISGFGDGLMRGVGLLLRRGGWSGLGGGSLRVICR